MHELEREGTENALGQGASIIRMQLLSFYKLNAARFEEGDSGGHIGHSNTYTL